MPLSLFFIRKDPSEQIHDKTGVLQNLVNIVGRQVPVVCGANVVHRHVGEEPFDGEWINFRIQIILNEFFRSLDERPGRSKVLHSVSVSKSLALQKTVPRLPLLNPSKGNGVQSITVATTPFIGICRTGIT